jgi:4-amino-4-deoxy-L-arabinose transferase-like glycosyltransferase
MAFPEGHASGPHPWLVVLLCVIYTIAGLTGHDPWKTDDALNLGIAHGFFASNDWRIPTVAGETVPEAEPLYHWIATTTASLTKPVLPFHDGARLASALFTAVFLFALGGAARRLYGIDAGWGAPLLAIGTLGLLVPLHEAQPASAILAASAVAYWGVAMLGKRSLVGALLAGSGIAGAFLAGGLGALLPLIAILLLPQGRRRWTVVLAALLVGGVIAATWPMLLFRQRPDFLDAWWAAELLALSSREGFSLLHLQWLAWFGWPVLYIALWTLWCSRRQFLTPAVMLPVAGLLVGLVWFLFHDARLPALLPLVTPMILLAASGTAQLKRGAANAWDWFSMMTVSIIAALVWLGTAAMYLGWPPAIARNIARLAPGFAAELWLPAVLVALALTLLWLAMLLNLPRSPWRVATRWAAGVTIVWALLVALWLPWIDYGKSYRTVVASLRRALPEEAGCIGRQNLGPGQRAVLDYFAGIRTRAGADQCHWLIGQSSSSDAADPEGWTRVWEGRRPGDRTEVWRLYRKR